MPSEIGPVPPVRAARTNPFAGSPAATGGRAPAAPTEPAVRPAVMIESAALAATPPVDVERVALIRAAIVSGSYPLVPTKIADAMIAAGLRLSLGE